MCYYYGTMSVMEDYLKKGKLDLRILRPGEVVEGTVLRKRGNELFLDVGSKSEGLISGSELDDGCGTFEKVSVGDSVLARVIQGNSKSGLAILSLKEASGERRWRRLEQVFENQEVLKSKVLDYNSGGVVVDVFEGVEGFLPLSHLDWSHFPLGGKEAILSHLVGKTLLVKIIELDPKSRRVVVSEKEALSDERRARGEKFLSTFEPGARKKGVVTGIVPFGLFVRLENTNIEGLVHISEVSWGKVSNLSDIYTIGDEVEVQILSCDAEGEKVSLSIKALKPNPWEKVKEKYSEGDVVSGEVARVTPFGAFIRLEEGIEGLVHVSETEGPLEPGEKVRAKIISFEPEEQRLGLSIRQVGESLDG